MSTMDRKGRADALKKLEEDSRQWLQTLAIAHVDAIVTGNMDDAEGYLREAIRSCIRLRNLQKEVETLKDKNVVNLDDQMLSMPISSSAVTCDDYDAFLESVNHRAGYLFRLFRAAYRSYPKSEGLVFDPEWIARLLKQSSDEMKKILDSFAPKESDIKELKEPCSHVEATVIIEDYGRTAVCTECLGRFSAYELAKSGQKRPSTSG